jgi:outer membrane receptor protein involved in Fe transport
VCAALLQNPAAHIAEGLKAQGVTPTPALIAAMAPGIVGRMCLPWSNALFAHFAAPNQQMIEGEWTGTLKAAYRWNDNVMTYASAARGYKSGGYNLDRVQNGVTPATDTSFPGEFVNSYELGTKTTWLGGNLLLNSTLFYQDYKDYQFNGFLGTTWTVLSIPRLTSKGVDTDVMWQTGIRGLMLQAGLTYADTRFGKDIPGAIFQPPTGALYRLPGAHPSFAPEWSGTAGITYEKDIAHDLLVRFNISAKYTSSQNAGTDLMPEKDQNPFTVVNARVGLGSSDGRWMLELWGENITNALYYEVAFNNPVQTASAISRDPANTFGAGYGDPRTYGLTFRYKY